MGFISFTTPSNISKVSIPVVPKTPGDIALTGLEFSSIYCGKYFIIWRVTSMSFITFGPNESGVTYIFPSPTTKISSFDSICLFIISLSSSDKISADF